MSYRARAWIWRDPEVYVIDLTGDRGLHDWLRIFYTLFQGEPTLYVIDDCRATKELKKKMCMLSYLAFSGRHALQTVWVLSQKYNAIPKDLREQTKWTALFYCKDRDSFEGCLRENDVVPAEEHAAVRKLLTGFSKLIMKTDQAPAYQVFT